jgi:hypothetical protein
MSFFPTLRVSPSHILQVAIKILVCCISEFFLKSLIACIFFHAWRLHLVCHRTMYHTFCDNFKQIGFVCDHGNSRVMTLSLSSNVHVEICRSYILNTHTVLSGLCSGHCCPSIAFTWQAAVQVKAVNESGLPDFHVVTITS